MENGLGSRGLHTEHLPLWEQDIREIVTEKDKKQHEELAECFSPEYANVSSYVIYADLLDKGIYLESVSTMYRILRERNLLHDRGETRCAQRRTKPKELRATGPNQVWGWDITYLPTHVNGIFLYAYVLMDVWSRKIEGVTILALFFSLGILPTYSLPRVSNDNTFSESLFKTLKFRPGYPKRFNDIAHARVWLADFVHWYNTIHLHSRIGYITPNDRHESRTPQIMAKRNNVLTAAREKHSERWSNWQMNWEEYPVVYLNPDPATRESIMRKIA